MRDHSDNTELTSKHGGRYIGPVVAEYMKHVDRTLIRENLKLTPEQRVEKMLVAAELADELRRAGKRLRDRTQ